MIEKEIFNNLEEYVKNYMINDYTGHDFEHIKRVVHTAKHIAKLENEDEFTVKILAYVHDLGDHKLNHGKACHKAKIQKALQAYDLPKAMVKDIIVDAQNIGYSTNSSNELSKAGKIVQDADRLDAMGAIGIARAFAYGASINQPINHYFTQHKEHSTREHFNDKLLKLKDLMNTKTGKKIAEERHQIMLRFLKHFDRETQCLFPC